MVSNFLISCGALSQPRNKTVRREAIIVTVRLHAVSISIRLFLGALMAGHESALPGWARLGRIVLPCLTHDAASGDWESAGVAGATSEEIRP